MSERPGADEERMMTTFWQFIVVLGASLGFPTAALLFLIGGPRFQDERRDRQPGPSGDR
ncbi:MULTISPECIES: hypothetical protein [Kitasatospora]|uniref:Uncharacterized protein n=1 Tax=Kitasatospora cathayae TaxID=3004092 RepID=A0ABY7Q4Y2_9ACTN|nr:hypothetical protein [Kitasatospora sp. HUAS 3-15]WBP87725.1 hypothetical protein O1G21_18995 [Kitasatospora sp. HUAS 3-15]